MASVTQPSRFGLAGKGGVRALVQDGTDPERMYAATGAAGMWRSEDGGRTWREINQGIVYKEGWSLVQQPRTGELYYGCGPTSVYRSADGGDSWEDFASIRALPTTKEWYFPTPPHISHIRHIGLFHDNPQEQDRFLSMVRGSRR